MNAAANELGPKFGITNIGGYRSLQDGGYHPQGRAFDTWQVDGQAVVAPSTPRSLVTAYMRAAGSYNVAGPVLLPAPTYFSDDTHHDHVHAGFRA